MDCATAAGKHHTYALHGKCYWRSDYEQHDIEIDWPEDLLADGRSAKPPSPPPGKEGWVHVRAQVEMAKGTCTYNADYWCPGPKSEGMFCDERELVSIRCEGWPDGVGSPHTTPVPEGKHAMLHVIAAPFQRDGACYATPEAWCDPSETWCRDLPPPTASNCP